MDRYVFTEPTNNIAPKKHGENFQGWKISDILIGGNVFLTCDVVSYPAPVFRFVWLNITYNLYVI